MLGIKFIFLEKGYWENKEIWTKDNFVALGANKKIITEHVKIQEKEDTGNEA